MTQEQANSESSGHSDMQRDVASRSCQDAGENIGHDASRLVAQCARAVGPLLLVRDLALATGGLMRIRVVQSGFGDASAWDRVFDGCHEAAQLLMHMLTSGSFRPVRGRWGEKRQTLGGWLTVPPLVGV